MVCLAERRRGVQVQEQIRLSPRLTTHTSHTLSNTELAKLNRKYTSAGPAIQEEKRRLAATIAEMTAQHDEHRLALEAMRYARECVCLYV